MIKVFPAGAGDCILVHFIKEDYRILIDGGYAETYHKYLNKYLTELKTQGKRINLLIVTHIDSDHIGGIQAFLKENGFAKNPSVIGVDEVWYNAFFHVNTMKVHSNASLYNISLHTINFFTLLFNLAIQNCANSSNSFSPGPNKVHWILSVKCF